MRIYFAFLMGALCMILAAQLEEGAPVSRHWIPLSGFAVGWVLAAWRPVARRLRILAPCLAVCSLVVMAALAGRDAWVPVLVIGAVVLVPGFVLAVASADRVERGTDSLPS